MGTSNTRRTWAKPWAKENVFDEPSTMEMLKGEAVQMTDLGKTTCPITTQTFPCLLTMDKAKMTMITTRWMILKAVEVIGVVATTKEKKIDLYHHSWPEWAEILKCWDSMRAKGNPFTTRSCDMVCHPRTPSILNGWLGISEENRKNASEPMSAFLCAFFVSQATKRLKPSPTVFHVKALVGNMYSLGLASCP